MNKDEKRKTARKEYEKPMLRVVNISSGIQTLGQGCKIAGSATPNFNLATSCGISNFCSVSGS